jgi:hypothetical protein
MMQPNEREVCRAAIDSDREAFEMIILTHSRALFAIATAVCHRQDRTDAQIDEPNALADLSIQVYSQGNMVSHETSLLVTLRRTIAQGAATTRGARG